MSYCEFYSSNAFAPGAQAQYIPDVDFQTTSLKLVISIDPFKQKLSGTCFTTLKPMSTTAKVVSFHANSMKIKNVYLQDGDDLKYTYDGKKIEIKLDKKYSARENIIIAIDYELDDPPVGLRFVRPDKKYPDRPYQVWSQGQPDDSRFWFPCHDVPFTKAVTETVITVPEDFVAVSNGGLLDVVHNSQNKTKTWHWKMFQRHSLYLVCIAVGRFSQIKDGSYNGAPIIYFCERGREEDVKRGFGKTPEVLKFFSEKTGLKYPYEKYAQIAAHEFGGGMENTTCTINTDVSLIDKRAALDVDFDGLVAHEAAHQWFGDYVTCKDWSQAWLNESFATYFDALFVQHDKGENEFYYEMYENAQIYFSEDREKYRRPIATNIYNFSWSLFDRHLYQKGSCILHFFRSVLSDELWWKAINYYLNKHKLGSVETQDLSAAILEATGKNFQPYFDQWIYKSGHPEFKITYGWDSKKSQAHAWLLQKHTVSADVPLFKIPLEFYFLVNGKEYRFSEKIEKREHNFKYKLPAEPQVVMVDPNYTLLLKKVDYIKPSKVWLNQLKLAKNVLARIEAAHHIASWGTNRALDFLANAFKMEKFWGAQREIAMAIASMQSESALDVLISALRVKNPKSRRAVVEALARFKSSKVVKALAPLLGRDQSYLVQSEAAAALGSTRISEARKSIEKALKLDSWNEIIRQGAIRGLGALNGVNGISEMKKFTKYGYDYTVRAAAISEIVKYGKGNPEARDHLISLLEDPNLRITYQAIMGLGQLGDPSVQSRLEKIKEKSPDQKQQLYADEAIRKIRLDIAK